MIEIRDIHENPVTILNPDGTELVTTNDKVIFDDIRLQIAQQKLEGYCVKFRGESIKIGTNGSLKIWPKGLMDTDENLLIELLDFIYEC